MALQYVCKLLARGVFLFVASLLLDWVVQDMVVSSHCYTRYGAALVLWNDLWHASFDKVCSRSC